MDFRHYPTIVSKINKDFMRTTQKAKLGKNMRDQILKIQLGQHRNMKHRSTLEKESLQIDRSLSVANWYAFFVNYRKTQQEKRFS